MTQTITEVLQGSVADLPPERRADLARRLELREAEMSARIAARAELGDNPLTILRVLNDIGQVVVRPDDERFEIEARINELVESYRQQLRTEAGL